MDRQKLSDMRENALELNSNSNGKKEMEMKFMMENTASREIYWRSEIQIQKHSFITSEMWRHSWMINYQKF